MSISVRSAFLNQHVNQKVVAQLRKLSFFGLRPLTIAATGAMLCLPVAAHAQQRDLTGVLSGSVSGAVATPKGDFATNVGNGYGVNASLLVRIDPQAIINARADFSFLGYASSTRRIPLAGSGNLVRLDLRTSSSIISVVGGPQLLGTRGVFSPYVAALGGFSYFFTETSVEGSDNTNSPFASTNNSGDAALAYGGAAGAYVQVYKSAHRDFRIEFGARYLRHDNVKYLNDQRVEEAFQNNRDPIPLRGRADFVTYHVGFNAILF